MSTSIKKVSQNRTKLQQNKQTKQNNKRPFFLPKINKVFLSPILQNLKGRSFLDKFFLKMILSTSRKGCHYAKSSSSSGSWSKTQNGGQNRIYPSLTLQTAKFVPLKSVLKNSTRTYCCMLYLFQQQDLSLA